MKKIMPLALFFAFNTMVFADSEIIAYKDNRSTEEGVKSFTAIEDGKKSEYVSICYANIGDDDKVKVDARIFGSTNNRMEIANRIRLKDDQSLDECQKLHELLEGSSKEQPITITVDTERFIIRLDK